MTKINAICEELCNLKDGETFKAVMTINEVGLAINSLNLDDRDFHIDRVNGSLHVTCHFKEECKKSEKTIAVIGILSVILFFLGSSVFMNL